MSRKKQRETDRFFTTSGVQLDQRDRGQFHFHREAFPSQLKSRVGLVLVGVRLEVRLLQILEESIKPTIISHRVE
jgi:hypothetical protein